VKNPVSLGILLTGFAYMLFTAHDAAIKLLVTTIPVWQILFFRSVTILVGCFLFGGPSFVGQVVHSPIVKPMMVRSTLLLVAWLSFYTAARYLQLAEVTTLYYAAPIVGTILAKIVLQERVTTSRWAAVGVGFAGVLIACNPVGLTISWPVYLALQAAVLWACAMVLLRKTALHEKSLIQMAISSLFFLVMTGVMMAFDWNIPNGYELALLCVTGVIAGIGQFALFEGMRKAPVSVLAPFEYTSLIWAFLLGYLIWRDVPAHNVFAGGTLILAAGCIIVVFERRAGRATA